MIDGLLFEYAYARICAGLSQRPDDRLWLQLRAARSVAALLDLVRGSVAAPTVSGIPVNGDGDVIEHALRQQLRAQIDEVASWMPELWRDAVRFTRHLIILPALAHLLTDEAAPQWIAEDPELGAYALASRAERETAIAAGPLAWIVAAGDDAGTRAELRHFPAARSRTRHSDPQHCALLAWRSEWHGLWPDTSVETAAALRRVEDLVECHLQTFGALAVADTTAARQVLAATLAAWVHRYPAHPAAAFAYLAVIALDFERLRAEFVHRARPLQALA